MASEKFGSIDQLYNLINHNPLKAISIFLIGLSLLFLSKDFILTITKNEFVQVDNNIYNNKRDLNDSSTKKAETKEQTHSEDKPNKTVENYITPNLYVQSVGSYEQYCMQIVNSFQVKAESADRKASLLLGRGITLSIVGILLYILSIIFWQWRASILGFKTQIIYGIISSTFLFIFIEFLSAWFLKQYRHFVDTSTYLMKSKAIFDKYLLLALIAKDLSELKNLTENRKTEIVKILGDEIKWPEIGKFSREDVSFAKEAMETASTMLKHAQAIINKDQNNRG